MKYVECVDEKRTISAYYHEKLRSGARVGIVRLADRVLVMKNGQILGDGPHDRLLQENEVYREIWQSQKSMYNGSNL